MQTYFLIYEIAAKDHPSSAGSLQSPSPSILPPKLSENFHTIQSTNHKVCSAQFIPLDVTTGDTIAASANKIEHEHGKLGLLAKNATEAGPHVPLQGQMRLYLDTNATGHAIVTSVFAKLLKKSTRIVHVTSGTGLIERRLDSSRPNSSMLAIPCRVEQVRLL